MSIVELNVSKTYKKITFFESYVKPLLQEAGKIGVSKKEIIQMVERAE
ncbi:hypothetical protein IMX26_06360 [Clostridium sp. 'deep sea']|nr:hypothetical protein [Clostridium sp. 'deep sea']QOR36429.1 hypothetical protein IMX26_06360 [Clostridium sp. 'deep sea']